MTAFAQALASLPAGYRLDDFGGYVVARHPMQPWLIIDKASGRICAEMPTTGHVLFDERPPRSCWEVLGLPQGASEKAIRASHRAKARVLHPDAGGSNAAMAELNNARDEALGRMGAR